MGQAIEMQEQLRLELLLEKRDRSSTSKHRLASGRERCWEGLPEKGIRRERGLAGAGQVGTSQEGP